MKTRPSLARHAWIRSASFTHPQLGSKWECFCPTFICIAIGNGKAIDCMHGKVAMEAYGRDGSDRELLNYSRFRHSPPSPRSPNSPDKPRGVILFHPSSHCGSPMAPLEMPLKEADVLLDHSLMHPTISFFQKNHRWLTYWLCAEPAGEAGRSAMAESAWQEIATRHNQETYLGASGVFRIDRRGWDRYCDSSYL